MVLAAPLVSAAVRISADLAASRTRAAEEAAAAGSALLRPGRWFRSRSRLTPRACARLASGAWVLARGHRAVVETPGSHNQRTTVDTRTRLVEQLVVQPGQAAGIAGRDPGWTGGAEFAALAKDELEHRAKNAVARPSRSSATHRSCSGRATPTRPHRPAGNGRRRQDSAIEHVMSGVNPQGVQVSVQAPSPRSSTTTSCGALEGAARARPHRHLQPVALRGSGRVKVHPEWLEPQRLPPGDRDELLAGALRGHQRLRAPPRPQRDKIVKCFLHVSKEVQKQRFLARLDTPGKEWKFNAADVTERARWDDYMGAFEDALTRTSTPWAPWHVIPADHKRLTQVLVGAVLADALLSLDLHWPEVSAADHAANLEARKRLEAETG